MTDPTRSPFPGMDPYLEEAWPDVHHGLCTYARDALRALLPPGLIARLDERTIIEGAFDRERVVVPDVRVIQSGRPRQQPPQAGGVAMLELEEPLVIQYGDEPVTEGFIRVIDTRNGGRVVTVIEFASPANKGSGRAMYQQKQGELLAGRVSLVEVDLIRSGKWNLRVPYEKVPPECRTPYHVCVTRGSQPNQSELYSITLRRRLPPIRIPLRETDADVRLDLQSLIDLVYLNGSYGFDINYAKPPAPPLDPDEAAWALEVIRARFGTDPAGAIRAT